MCIVEEPDGEVHGDLNDFTSRTTHPTHRSGRLHVGLYALESRIKDLLGLAGNTGGRIIHDIYGIHDFGASRLRTSVSSHCDLAFDPPLRHVLDCRGLASANIATRSPSYVQYQSRRSSAEIRLALALPAAAVDRPLQLGQVVASTKGNTWRLFTASLLISTPAYIFTLIIASVQGSGFLLRSVAALLHYTNNFVLGFACLSLAIPTIPSTCTD